MSLSPFFIGRGSNLGSVHEATARSFKELVDRYLNIAVPLNCSRAEYAKMTDDGKRDAKKVNFLVPAVFQTSPSRRITEKAEHCNLLHIDLDRDPDGTYPATAFVNNPGSLHIALHPWSFAAYTTASSTPEGPRMRVIVLADKIPVSKYAQAVLTVFQLLGVKNITTESKVPIQPMYLPSLFRGEDPETVHPLVTHNCTGPAFTVADIQDIVATEFSRPMKPQGLEAMDFLRPQMPEITLDIARDALSAMDPDMPYPEWLQMAASLRHQFSPNEADEAYALFDDWSAKGVKYGGPEDTLAKWKSLRPTPEGRAPVTIRTLIRRATAKGWSCEFVKDQCFQNLRNWMETGARSPTALLSEGVGKIVATPLITKVEENALLSELVRQAKRRFGVSVKLGTLERELRAMRSAIHKKCEEEKGEGVPTWAKGIVHVSKHNLFFRHSTGEEWTTEAVNAHFSRHLIPNEAQLRENGAAPTLANLARPQVLPAQFLLNSLQIPTIYDYDYDPSSPDDLFTVSNEVSFLNTYVRCHPIPDAQHSRFAGNAFVRHLERMIGVPDYVRILMDFLAFLVQSPGQKVRWTILLQGAQGCGKSLIGDVMRTVLGERHVRIVDSLAIHSNYNEWIRGCTFALIEEIRVAGVNRAEVMNNLKPLATNTVVRVHQKFKDTCEIKNRLNFIACTNFKDAIVVDETDRRWCIIQCAIQTKRQVLDLQKDYYFKNLYGIIEKCPGGLRHFFENWRISDGFNPNGHAPATRYMAELVASCASETVAAVRTVISDGDSPWVQHDLLSSVTLLQLTAMQPGIDRLSHQQLAKILREDHYVVRGRHTVSGERHWIWTKLQEFPEDLDPAEELGFRVSASANPNLKFL